MVVGVVEAQAGHARSTPQSLRGHQVQQLPAKVPSTAHRSAGSWTHVTASCGRVVIPHQRGIDVGDPPRYGADHLKPVRLVLCLGPPANRSCGPTAKSRRMQEITRGGDERQ